MLAASANLVLDFVGDLKCHPEWSYVLMSDCLMFLGIMTWFLVSLFSGNKLERFAIGIVVHHGDDDFYWPFHINLCRKSTAKLVTEVLTTFQIIS